MDSLAGLLGSIFGFSLYGFLWWLTWKSAKKRKIGLTITSYIALFFTPLIAYLVTFSTKKINKKNDKDENTADGYIASKIATLQERLKYENLTAMLIAAILFIVLGSSTLPFTIVGICMIGWGVALLSERKNLLWAKDHGPVVEKGQEPSGKDSFHTLFVFESNNQLRIDTITQDHITAHSNRRIVVDYDGGEMYKLSIVDSENGQFLLQPVLMYKNSYSDLDDCLSMISDDNTRNYTLYAFYKEGQVNKCVIYLKSKKVNIHYNKE